MPHVETMTSLSAVILECEDSQEMINIGRTLNPYSQKLQLEMDRAQAELDDLVKQVRTAQNRIASMN